MKRFIKLTEPLGTINVNNHPDGIAINPVTNMIYVANNVDNNVSVINGATNTPIDTITVGKTPTATALNSVTDRTYVANFNNSTVSVIR